MLKDFIKRLFPAPARRTQLQYEELLARMDALEAQNQRLAERQQELLREERDRLLELLVRVENHDNDMARRVTDANRDVNRQLDDVNRHLTTDIQHLTGLCQSEFVIRGSSAESYYLLQHIRRLQRLFCVSAPTAGVFVRVGRPHDGGYLMLDDFAKHEVAYSFGISDDVSWDRDMAHRGLDVYMYDHTIAGLPEQDDRFHWQKIGLAGVYDAAHPELETLEQILAENGHSTRRGMILKMDIEGAEWEVLRKCPSEIWGQFSQVVFEFHHLNDLSQEDRIAEGLERLNQAQCLVHVHANNWESYVMAGGLVMPDALECTYLNREEYACRAAAAFFPTQIDQANNPWKPEIVLGKWGNRQDES